MSSVFDAVFGGSARDASRAQTAGLEQSLAEVRRSTDQARREVKPLFSQAETSRLERTQQALDALQGGFQPSVDAITQGNLQAQEALSGSLPQFQNAILGQPVDYSFAQARQFDVPEFNVAPTIFNRQEETAQQPTFVPPANNPVNPNIFRDGEGNLALSPASGGFNIGGLLGGPNRQFLF